MPLTVGTAGHIDHGKTWLVRALTGKDTDRLPEEQRRGISIDLGYAQLELPDGRRLSLVDVPGHERFVRNMVAGATGIDLFLLVIDAAEGARPQTHEHLAILRLLGIERGVVAVTKADAVDEETLGLAVEEARELAPGAEVVAVSAKTGEGLDELRAALAAVADERTADEAPTRLYVDRVFTLRGIGTVVTVPVPPTSVGPTVPPPTVGPTVAPTVVTPTVAPTVAPPTTGATVVTPPIDQSDAARLADCEVRARQATVSYDTARSMTLDQTQQFVVTATIQGTTPAGSTTVAPDVTVVAVALRCEVQAQLRGADFRVDPAEFQPRSFLDQPSVEWSWDVVPLKAGTSVLNLEIRSVAVIDGRRIEGADTQLYQSTVTITTKDQGFGSDIKRWTTSVVDFPLVRGFGSLLVIFGALAAAWRGVLKRPWPWKRGASTSTTEPKRDP